MQLDEHVVWTPVTERDKEQVLRQMERLLETTHFRNSRRYPALLRFIVEETLAGRGEFLKERLLGVHVFGRPSDYDTASDPVVRVTVAEIRKRIAQYYHDERNTHELRIELLPGRYEPEFRISNATRQQTPTHSEPEPPAPAITQPALDESTPPLLAAVTPAEVPVERRRSPWVLAGCVVLLVLVGLFAARASRPDALDRFWKPILTTREPITLCLPVAGGKYGVAATSKVVLPSHKGHSADGQEEPSTGTYLVLESLGENVVFSDVRAMTSLSNLLAQHGAEQRLRLNTAVTLDDLRQGPAILIGALDNPWTLRALSHLRYQFDGSNDETYWIVDTKSGKSTGWSLDLKTPIGSVTRDYAIIARVHAEDTGEQQVVVAGIGMSGTAAAGDLLTSRSQIEALRERVGSGFDHQDFEAVISTDVVNGIAGTPRILTVEVQ